MCKWEKQNRAGSQNPENKIDGVQILCKMQWITSIIMESLKATSRNL